jgi:tRNA-specific 2-thiouridylase
VSIDPEERKLVVGPRAALAVAAARVEGINWLAEDQIAVEAKVRSLARPVPVTLTCSPPKAGAQAGEACVSFSSPEYGVAPGQSAVFYDGERLLGGGTIVATTAAVMAVAA